MQLDKLKELEDLHARLGGLDFGCGCCGGDTTSDSMDWAERVFDLFPELVAAAKRATTTKARVGELTRALESIRDVKDEIGGDDSDQMVYVLHVARTALKPQEPRP